MRWLGPELPRPAQKGKGEVGKDIGPSECCQGPVCLCSLGLSETGGSLGLL